MPFGGQKCAKGCLNLGLHGMCSSQNGTSVIIVNKLDPKCLTVANCSQILFTPWGGMAVSMELQPGTSISILDIHGNISNTDGQYARHAVYQYAYVLIDGIKNMHPH